VCLYICTYIERELGVSVAVWREDKNARGLCRRFVLIGVWGGWCICVCVIVCVCVHIYVKRDRYVWGRGCACVYI